MIDLELFGRLSQCSLTRRSYDLLLRAVVYKLEDFLQAEVVDGFLDGFVSHDGDEENLGSYANFLFFGLLRVNFMP